LSDPNVEIARHKTAIFRPDLSLPVKCALRDGVLTPEHPLFDYGCGLGRDVELLTERGFPCGGWDPAHFPDPPRTAADVVNFSYVLNVIEDPDERAAALEAAWRLCTRVLVVAAQITVAGRGQDQVEFGDGILTKRGTFQKYYEQGELKAYLESRLGREAIPAGLGIFYVFKDEAAGQAFLASRYRRRAAAPRKRVAEARFEAERTILEPFLATLAALGRLPEEDECPEASILRERFGSLKRAFALVRRVTGAEPWEAIAQRCREDLLVYLALGRFRGRPPIGKLPTGLQRDIRAFFGSYTAACRQADERLFRAGDVEAVDEACRRSTVGKLLPTALYVHRSALDGLDPLLRVYEGCARAYLGEIEGANLIKLHRGSGRVSYLAYPEFETDPHPALRRSVTLDLATREIACLDYAASANPPVLHRKETFLAPDHPLAATFARLTKQEEAHGLLEDTASIGTREGWEGHLREAGWMLRGHRLVRRRGGR
jgi:DNA phosphorothioation-associated putative methyltransferase